MEHQTVAPTGNEEMDEPVRFLPPVVDFLLALRNIQSMQANVGRAESGRLHPREKSPRLCEDNGDVLFHDAELSVTMHANHRTQVPPNFAAS